MNGWQSCPKYRAVSDIPFLACNAAATISMVPYTPNDHFHGHVANARACEHKEEHHSTQCTFYSCVVLFTDPRTAENGVLIGKTKMSYCGMVGLG